MSVEIIPLNVLDHRRRCECCHYPTLVVSSEYPTMGDWQYAIRSCPLCDWESRALTDRGEPDPNAESDEQRNDGLSVLQARINFERFLSIYDPDEPPPWRGLPPSARVLGLRRSLSEAYQTLLATEQPSPFPLWEQVRAYEAALRQASADQQAEEESSFDDSAS